MCLWLYLLDRAVGRTRRRARPPDYLDAPVFSEPAGTLTRRQLCQNAVLLGATGSGKTTFLLWLLARVLRDSGALLVAAKAGDAANYERIARSLGKEVVVLGPGAEGVDFFGSCIPPNLPLEDRGVAGGLAFDALAAVLSREKRKAGGDNAFFYLAAQQFVRYSIDLLSLAGAPVTAERILQIAVWTPRSPEQMQTANWSQGWLARYLDEAEDRGEFSERVRDYFTVALPNLGERTLGSILSEVEATADLMCRGVCQKLTSGTLSPAALIDRGAVVIVDCPFMVLGDVGRVASAAVVHAFQQSLLRREVTETTPLYGVVIDESQEILTDTTASYAAVCRQQRSPLICATQCVSGLGDKLGSKERALALMGNLANKFVFSSTPETAKYVSESLLGRARISFFGGGTQASPDEPGKSTASASVSQHMELSVEPQQLFRLKDGSDGEVECLWFRPSEPWTTLTVRRE